MRKTIAATITAATLVLGGGIAHAASETVTGPQIVAQQNQDDDSDSDKTGLWGLAGLLGLLGLAGLKRRNEPRVHNTVTDPTRRP
jgi:MYXO-CTERM domain-containing protein